MAIISIDNIRRTAFIVPAIGAPKLLAVAPDIRLPKDNGNMANERTPMTRPRISLGVSNSSKAAMVIMANASATPTQPWSPRENEYQGDQQNAPAAMPAAAEAPMHNQALC